MLVWMISMAFIATAWVSDERARFIWCPPKPKFYREVTVIAVLYIWEAVLVLLGTALGIPPLHPHSNSSFTGEETGTEKLSRVAQITQLLSREGGRPVSSVVNRSAISSIWDRHQYSYSLFPYHITVVTGISKNHLFLLSQKFVSIIPIARSCYIKSVHQEAHMTRL